MPVEIERKFLVNGTAWKKGQTGTLYRQGYVGASGVRIRIAGKKAFLTLKSKPLENAPLTRNEFEYPIPLRDAQHMLDHMCDPAQIEKIRYLVAHEGQTWEVDEFRGSNAGLVVAEIELNDEKQKVALPDWLGEEVSLDPRYTNANLAKNPVSAWK